MDRQSRLWRLYNKALSTYKSIFVKLFDEFFTISWKVSQERFKYFIQYDGTYHIIMKKQEEKFASCSLM